ncbi:helix-turn-helix domain-containing protein [Streptomyces halstedii]|uniref:Helix-turn-helix domain-containing protein n=1 Tax=Streptomyces halstedii TaxID=1944 RepID=A0ABS6TKD0_STRHA|nr:helix-turn-helix domain-containing protein [Streptomyces halstedii]MBV7668634.1 helix-turn-helix domain-containing protein [Streptomyces halstedii]
MSTSSDPPDPRLLLLGLHIRRLREERGLSLEELAELSGLSFRGLVYVEHGRRNAGVLTLLQIAEGLQVAPSRLVTPFDGPAGADTSDAPRR